MQDRYVGDIGDFGKYGLLKALCQNDMSLGVVWYLVPNESHTNDGKHVSYLEPTLRNVSAFRSCDTGLYNQLQTIVRSDCRSVAEVRVRGILPRGTTFFEEPLEYSSVLTRGWDRPRLCREHRQAWLSRALEQVAASDLVFLDPDNGLEVGTRMEAKTGPKYVYYEEVEKLGPPLHSLVIYHHLGRQESGHDQVIKRVQHLEARYGERPLVTWYHRGTARVYFVILKTEHRELLQRRLSEFTSPLSPWSDHFDWVDV